MKRRLRNSEAQAGRLADEVARLNGELRQLRREKADQLDRGIADLYNHAGQRLTLITPGGFLIYGIIVNLTEECAEVGGMSSAELRVALTL